MKITCPGFVDLQVNGFAGVDYNTPGRSVGQIEDSLAAMRRTGVTRCLPTLITSSFERFADCVRPILACANPAIAGLHMEGPYISPLDGARGAHPQAHVVPADIDDFKRRQDAAGGRILLVTLAPESPGALKLTEYLIGQGIRVAIGHTAATREQLRDGVRAGATLATHLGNGCPQFVHRHDNVIWELLANDGLMASLIVDGFHLPASVVKSMVRAKGPERTMLVTDAVSAAAAAPACYWLGDLQVELGADGRVTQPGSPNFAGSALTMDRAVALAAEFCELPLEDILPLATTQPARYLGIETAGTLEGEWDPSLHHLAIRTVI